MTRGPLRRTICLIVTLAALSGCSSRLHNAIWNGDVERVRELLDRGASPNNYVYDFGEPVGLASRFCNHEMLRLLLEHGAHTEGASAELALRDAVRMCDVGIVSLLLDHGFDPNASYYLGNTILMHAVERGNLEIISVLLDHDADACARGQHASPVDPHQGEENALLLATRLGDPDVVRLLIARGDSSCPR